MLAALAALLLMGEPSGIAADSPAEAAEPEAVTQVEEPMAEERATAEETKPVWEGPVPVSERVEDTYFDDAVFLGDSRTDGLRIYGGMNHGTYLQFTGATVESVFTKAVETPVEETAEVQEPVNEYKEKYEAALYEEFLNIFE